jgi:4-amino-4-deoxy-L-arabinose transferase-like glycosyltransferase
MCLAGLGRAAVGDSDEAFYAEAAREMIASGNWLTPTYNFDERFQKPVLYYWLTAATYLVAGVSATAARWWSAMSAVAIAVVVYWATRRWYDAATAQAAGLIAATSVGSALMARMALPDLPLAAFVTGSVVSAFVAIFDDEQRSLPWMLLAAALAALAMLTKGPVGPLVAALAVGGAVLVDRKAAKVRPSDIVMAAFAFLVIAAPWYVVMAAQHGTAYLTGFFIGDNFERFATTRFNDPRPVWFYLPILAIGLMPWTPFAILGIPTLRRGRGRQISISNVDRRVIMWALVPLVFFSASVGKQPRYILPILPPLAILLARGITLYLSKREVSRTADRLLRSAAALSGVLTILYGVSLYRARPLMESEVASGILFLASAATIVSGAIIVSRSVRGALARLVPAIALTACVSMLVGTFRVMVRNLVFYTRLRTIDLTTDEDLARFVDRRERLLLVIGRHDREMLEERTGRKLKVLGSARYFNSAILKVRTFIVPEPEREVVEVEVVSTR